SASSPIKTSRVRFIYHSTENKGLCPLAALALGRGLCCPATAFAHSSQPNSRGREDSEALTMIPRPGPLAPTNYCRSATVRCKFCYFGLVSERNPRPPMAHAQKFALALAGLFCAGMWLYVDRVLIGHQVAEARDRGIPRGNLSDLYPSWLASRELLLHHRDPYTPEITREIQAGYYGRLIDPSRPNDPKNQQAFAYPLYVALLLAPTVKLQFAQVQVIFRWLLAGLTALSVLLWLAALGWKQSGMTAVTLTLLVFGTFPVVQGIKLQQLSLMVAAFLAS